MIAASSKKHKSENRVSNDEFWGVKQCFQLIKIASRNVESCPIATLAIALAIAMPDAPLSRDMSQHARTRTCSAIQFSTYLSAHFCKSADYLNYKEFGQLIIN